MEDTATTSPAWNDDLLVNPHAAADKRNRVRRMFASIAGSYDLNNRLHSFWLDQYWRRRAVALAELRVADAVLDVACGTGDLALKFHAALRRLGNDSPSVIGLDFTYEMLPLARRKSHSQLSLINGDATALPLADASVDVVSIAFGIRNVQEPIAALREFRRVLRPGGRVIILEFSQPDNRLIRWLNDLYCVRIMPHTATWISGDRSGAYKYLPMSVRTFANRQEMLSLMQKAGFGDTQCFPLTFGVSCVFRGRA